MFAKIDIRSYNHQLLYANAGDDITILHQNGHVLICESKFGKFPCTIDKLTDIKPAEPEVILRAPKSADKDQLNLFGL